MAVTAVGRPGAARCRLLRLLSFLLVAGPALCWNDPDRILLRDVKALTLHYDRYTTSRRLDPIPQLKCVGGTAGCDAYTPKVIQCQNRGWDGYDVQWECKTDLDIAYKFGSTVVSCEGYESSEDQYVLRGSCGLEYQLDYTELGLKKLKETGKHQGFSDYYHKLYSADSCGVGGLVTIGVLLALAFAVYKLFLSDGQASPPPYSEYPPYSQRYQRFTNAAGAPPPGFKSEFTGPQNTGFGSAFTGQGCDSSGPGFWTGLGTGGLLGYLFGSNRAATPFSNSWYHPSYPSSYSGAWNSRAYSPLGGGTGAILHPPAQMQTQGPEQPQDMAAPEDGKVGSWRQTLDAEFDLSSPSLYGNSQQLFCFLCCFSCSVCGQELTCDKCLRFVW